MDENKPVSMAVTVSLKTKLVETIKALSDDQHRSFSKQVAFFLDQAVRELKKEKAEECKEEDK